MPSQVTFERLLAGSPLRRRSYAVLTALVLLVVLLFAAWMNLRNLGGLSSDVIVVFLKALAASAALSFVPIAVLWYLDRRERESRWLVLVAVLWGAVIATGLALPLNNAILRAIHGWVRANPQVTTRLGADATLLIGAPIAGPLNEEITKGLGIVALLLLMRSEFDNMRDGFIYGALVGLGFNLLEAPLYVAQNYAEFGVLTYGLQLGGRFALLGFGGHALYSGLFGAFLGLGRQTRRAWLRWVLGLVGLLVAMLPHALNNGLGLILIGSGVVPPDAEIQPPTPQPFLPTLLIRSIMELIIFSPFLALLAVLLWRSGAWERRVIREELASEVGGAVTPEEYAAIQRDGIFRTRRIPARARRRMSALVMAQNELAFRKRHVRIDGGDADGDALAQAWRAEIAQLRE
jgi:RsiW-degrading membrane proteinase PrsW (M82 family)